VGDSIGKERGCGRKRGGAETWMLFFCSLKEAKRENKRKKNLNIARRKETLIEINNQSSQGEKREAVRRP